MVMDRAERAINGFVTEDIRHGGDRVGFMVEFDNGESRVLSHVDFDGPRVGKYGVDLETMDWVVQRMQNWETNAIDLQIVDELGKMELKHEEFPDVAEESFDSEIDLLATIPSNGLEFVERLRSRDDVTELQMTEERREEVQIELIQMLDLKTQNG